MGYDRDESYPLEFEPNGIQFGSKSKGNCQYDHIPFNLKGNGIFFFHFNGKEISEFSQCILNIILFGELIFQTEKTYILAVREICVCRHHGG